MVLEDISDEEDSEIHALAGPFFAAPSDHQPLITSTASIDKFSPVEDTGNNLDTKLSTARVQTRRVVRSDEAGQRRNRKQNLHLRPFRDRHILVRPLFHRFTMKRIRQLLRERGVRFVHLKADRQSNYLSIGMKHSDLVGTYFDRIPGDIFSEHNYHLYRDRERKVVH